MNNAPRRGRPPTSIIEQKIKEGMVSNSQVKCHMCLRVFPRLKSLRAHYKCHTGETPYKCDYPGCHGAFRQSGHLRSHFFRHSGEKPFRCKTPDCKYRYTHANRHCPDHDPLKLKKLGRDKGVPIFNVNMNNVTEDQRKWLQRYMERRLNLYYRLANRNNNNPPDSRPRKRNNHPRDPIFINRSNNSRDSKPTNSNNSPPDYFQINRNNNPRDYSSLNRNNNHQGTKRPAENDSDAENIPANKKTAYGSEGYSSAGSESPSSSPGHHRSVESDTGSNSSFSSPSSLHGMDEGDLNGVSVLIMLQTKVDVPIDRLLLYSGYGNATTHFTALK